MKWHFCMWQCNTHTECLSVWYAFQASPLSDFLALLFWREDIWILTTFSLPSLSYLLCLLLSRCQHFILLFLISIKSSRFSPLQKVPRLWKEDFCHHTGPWEEFCLWHWLTRLLQMKPKQRTARKFCERSHSPPPFTLLSLWRPQRATKETASVGPGSRRIQEDGADTSLLWSRGDDERVLTGCVQLSGEQKGMTGLTSIWF